MLFGSGTAVGSEELVVVVSALGAGVAVPEWDGWVASGTGVVSGAELVVGGAVLLVVATGVGRSEPVLPTVPVSVPVLLTVPESEWEVSMPSVLVLFELPVPVPTSFVVSVLVLSEVVFSGRPVVVVRGLPPLCEGVPEPDVGLPEFVPVPVLVVGGTTLVLDPLATGTSGEGAGVEVFEVSEEVDVSFC